MDAVAKAKYKELKAELDSLKGLADSQKHHFKKARELLYEGLARVYVLWQEAQKTEGLLEQLYDECDIQYKRETIKEINFSPLLRYLWSMDGTVDSATIGQWSNALNNVNIAVQNDKEFYKINTINKIVTYISTNGGITALAGYSPKLKKEDTTAAKVKLSRSAEEKQQNAHLAEGKKFFAQQATPLAEIGTGRMLPAADSGFTLGLLRKGGKGYELLGAIDDTELVNQVVVTAYKRSSAQMPNTARLLTDIIRTQVLPAQVAGIADSLADMSKYSVPEEKGKGKMKQLKRLLYVAKDKAFVLSANRSDCSVVTIAKPKYSIFCASNDLALAVGDRRYIEANLIHSGDFNFYTADSASKVEAIEGEAATHRLRLENTVTKRFRFIRFYPLSAFKFPPSKTQAVISDEASAAVKYTAKLDSKWIGEMHGRFLSRWVNGFGAKMKRAEYELLGLALNKTGIIFKHTYKGGDFKEFEDVPFDSKATTKGNVQALALSKDIIPVLHALVKMEIDGDVLLQADEKMIGFSFSTDCADYKIAVPCATAKAKRIGDYFTSYGG